MGKSNKQIIRATIKFTKENLTDDPAHDWWHTYRVWKVAVEIGKKEKADLFVVQMAALLHDIDDWKIGKNTKRGESKLLKTRKWLRECRVNDPTTTIICSIIHQISFKGAKVSSSKKTLEANVVQDADRLDAMGAIGIARAFTYGGKAGRSIFDPAIPKKQSVPDLRKKDSPSSIHHFYDKLLLLKGRINTSTGKKIAADRHQFLTNFLFEFYWEWDVKKL